MMTDVENLVSNKNRYPGSLGVADVFQCKKRKRGRFTIRKKRQVMAQHCRRFQTQHAQEQKIRWETSEHTKVE